MSTETEQYATNVHLDDPRMLALVQRAREADDRDSKLTIKQAVSRNKKAVFWAFFLSTALIMEGYDVVIITSFYGQTQFQNRFGVAGPDGTKSISAAWQSGLANSALVGQLAGLLITGYSQDYLGSRVTYMTFMFWEVCAIFLTFFAPNLSVLAFGEAMCGIGWGVFQTLTTTYAAEVVPTVLRPYVTSYVCVCWGFGILLSSGVVRAASTINGDIGWRLPFAIQWVWPVPLFFAAYFAPESPWNAVRRGRPEQARKALRQLKGANDSDDESIESTVAYMEYVTLLEKAETSGASFLQCFKGTNLRRTEINCMVWSIQILDGNPLLSYAVVFLEQAGFDETTAFDINIALSGCFVIGGFLCWFLLARFGRKPIYMTGMIAMFICEIIMGILGCFGGTKVATTIGIILVISTIFNVSTIGPTCYPIVAETPSGRLRYKTIAVGRFVYNLVSIFQNSVTPRMLSPTAWNWGAKSGFFWAGTNFCCIVWCYFRMPETKDRPFGEIDILFENRVPARKFASTKVDQFATAQQNEKAEGNEGEHVETKDPILLQEA